MRKLEHVYSLGMELMEKGRPKILRQQKIIKNSLVEMRVIE